MEPLKTMQKTQTINHTKQRKGWLLPKDISRRNDLRTEVVDNETWDQCKEKVSSILIAY